MAQQQLSISKQELRESEVSQIEVIHIPDICIQSVYNLSLPLLLFVI